MKTRHLFLLATAVLFTNCMQDEIETPLTTATIVATVEEDATKAEVDENGIFTWTKGDKIAIHTDKDNLEGTLKGNGGSSNGTFTYSYISGVDGTPSGYATYPYAEGHKVTGETLTYVLPAYYDLGENLSNTNAPMLAMSTQRNAENTYNFKHLGGLFRFEFKNAPKGTSKFTLSLGGQKINGQFTTTIGENPATIVTGVAEDGESTTTLEFTPLKADNTDITLYVPVPTGDYQGITATLYAGEEELGHWGKASARNTVERRSIVKMAPISFESAEGGIDNNNVSTEAQLKAAVEAGGLVSLATDIQLTQPLIINKDVVVNLNGATLTAGVFAENGGVISEGTTDSYAFWVKDGALTIEGDGVVEAQNAKYSIAVWANGGNVVLNGGTYKNSGTGCDLVYVSGSAKVEINGGEYIATLKGDAEGTNNKRSAINIKDADRATCNVTVKGGKFYEFNPADNVSEVAHTNFTADNTMVVVSEVGGAKVYEVIDLSNGYTLTSNVEIATPITINTTGTIDFNLGNYSLSNKTAYDYDECGDTESYVFEVQAGTLNINGNGAVNAIAGAAYDMAVFANRTGKVNINGGKFTNLGQENDGSDLIYVRDNAAVVINGGEFEAGNKSSDVGGQYVALNMRDADCKAGTCSIVVKGGKFYKFNPADNVSEVAHTNFTADNTMVVVSEVDGVKVYEVIDLSNGYTLTSDVEIATPIKINTTGTIDFNLGNYSLTNRTAYDYDECGETESYVFDVQAGTLNINGNGAVNAIAGAAYDMAVFANGTGKVNINGGKFTNLGQENDGSDLIYVRDNAAVVITGGEFEAGNKSSDVGGQYVALNMRDADCKAGTCSIVVKGGKFYKFNPADNVSENPKVNFVAPGKSSVANGSYYEVVDGIADETALTLAVASGVNVKLINDITLTTYIEVRTEITVDLNGYSITHPANSKANYKDVFEIYGEGKLTIEGNGDVIAEDGYCVYAAGNSTVIINGGYYVSPVTTVDARKNAKVTINDGTFKVDGTNNPDGDYGQIYTLNLRDKTGNYVTDLSEIVVKGGKYYKYNPAESPSENPVANFVAEGYKSVIDGDWYIVTQ